MFSFFKKESQKENIKVITLQLNDRCSPITRGQMYREPLDKYMELKGLGEVEGGGTQLEKSGERAYCELEIMIENESAFNIEELKTEIERIGVPKGSYLILDDETIFPLGTLEGVGVYFRYMEAPEKLFDEIDMDDFWDGIDEAVKEYGKYHDNWQGSEIAVFYYYGLNAELILKKITEKMVGHPFESYIDPTLLSLDIK